MTVCSFLYIVVLLCYFTLHCSCMSQINMANPKNYIKNTSFQLLGHESASEDVELGCDGGCKSIQAPPPILSRSKSLTQLSPLCCYDHVKDYPHSNRSRQDWFGLLREQFGAFIQ